MSRNTLIILLRDNTGDRMLIMMIVIRKITFNCSRFTVVIIIMIIALYVDDFTMITIIYL